MHSFIGISQVKISDRRELPIHASEIWEKMFKLNQNENWITLKETNDYIYSWNYYNCEIQKKLHTNISIAINEKKSPQITEILTEFIANSILIELYNTKNIENINIKKKHVKDLYIEVVSIQVQLKKLDFNLYKELVLLIKQIKMVKLRG